MLHDLVGVAGVENPNDRAHSRFPRHIKFTQVRLIRRPIFPPTAVQSSKPLNTITLPHMLLELSLRESSPPLRYHIQSSNFFSLHLRVAATSFLATPA